MLITISNYEIMNFENDNLIFSEKGISKITSRPLWNALLEIKQSQPQMTQECLDEIFNRHELPVQSTKAFVEKIITIREQHKKPWLEKVAILYDPGLPYDFEGIIGSELKRPIQFHHDAESLLKESATHKQYINIFCTAYNYSKTKDLYFKLAALSPKSAISISYFTGASFCVSQPYINEIGNPCHFCTMDRICSYENTTRSRNSWSKLLSFCRPKNLTLPSKKLTLLQINLALGLLTKQIKLYTESDSNFRYQDNALQSVSIDLISGSISEDPTSHWFLCKCLRCN
jgi:McbB family protein